MTQLIRIEQHGGPEVLTLCDVELPAPGAGEVRVRNEVIGLNYIDTYHRSGLYPLPLPTGIGLEGAGVVEAVGEGVSDLVVGDRVAYCSAGFGAYAQCVNLPAERMVPLPDDISFAVAAASLLKGQTAEYLINRCYSLGPGDTCLFHAAAGGVGLIFGQWASALGATVIGTVGSEEKAATARAHGFHHVINYHTENVVKRVEDITEGAKLPVVYDGVGRDTFNDSIDCLRPRGLMVSFGNASGAPEPVDLQLLSQKGSLYITRPTLFSYTATREDLLSSAQALFDRILSNEVHIEINQRYALADVQQAHRDLEARKTTGSSILLP